MAAIIRPTFDRRQLEIVRLCLRNSPRLEDAIQEYERQRLLKSMNLLAAKHDIAADAADFAESYLPKRNLPPPMMAEDSRKHVLMTQASDAGFASLTEAEQDFIVLSWLKTTPNADWSDVERNSFNRRMLADMSSDSSVSVTSKLPKGPVSAESL